MFARPVQGEQGLLLLVWRRNIRNDIWKLCYRQSRRGVSRQDSEKCKTVVCIANTFTNRRFLHTDAFKHKAFTHRGLLHKHCNTNTFTHRSFYIQTLLRTDAFTHKRFDTQTLLHTDAFYTQNAFYTQTLSHTNTCTHRGFYTNTFTQTLLHKHFYTQKLLHTNTFTHRRFYTQTLWHTDATIGPHFVRKGCSRTSQIAILPQFLPIGPSFRAKGLLRDKSNRNFTSVFADRPSFVRCERVDVSWLAAGTTLGLKRER